MKSLLKKIVKRSLLLSSLFYIFYKVCIKIKAKLGNIHSQSGTTHATLDLEQSLNYIQDVFKDYQQVSGRTQFEGCLAECGPGDNVGVALMFLNNGISSVDLPDRFYSLRNAAQQASIYQALCQRYPTIQALFEDQQNFDETHMPRLKRYYGDEAAAEQFFDRHQGYDYIISRSVLEHLDDPLLALKKMVQALKPGGLLIHKVDLRDHEMFTPYSHALKFLEVPSWIYQWMVHGTGYPNRVLFHRYRTVLQALNPGCHFYVAGLHGIEHKDYIYPIDAIPEAMKQQSLSYVNAHRQNLAAEFQSIPSEDLMIASFFLVCEKPIKAIL